MCRWWNTLPPVSYTHLDVYKRQVLECRTVFLSDLHLGTKECKADECRTFLKHVRAGKIVLVGDIVDAWAFSRGSRWRRRHTRFVRTLLRKMEQEDVEVLYLRGNHDDIDVYKRQPVTGRPWW